MNYLFSFSFKNINRNRKRTLLTLVGIVIAVSFLILINSLMNGLIDQLLEGAMKASGHIVIQSKDYTKSERLLPLDKGIKDIKGLMNELRKIKGIDIITPRINSGGIFISNDDAYTALGTAIDPPAEKSFLRLENNLVAGTYFTGKTNEIIIGLEIAKKLGYKPGDFALFVTKNSLGSIAAKKLRVAGIADFNMYELNRTFYMDMNSAYKLFKNEESPQKIILILKDFNLAGKIKNELLRNAFIKENNLDVFKADETGIFQTIFPLFLWILRFNMVLFLLAALMVIANTMAMTVIERTAEIGVLQAMGMKRRQAILSVIIESSFMGVIGSLTGALIAGPISFYLKDKGILIGENLAKGMPIAVKNVIYPDVSMTLIIMCMAFGILISVIAGAFPSFIRIKKMNIAQAIRSKSG